MAVKIKPTAQEVLTYLRKHRDRFVTVPELSRAVNQMDVRKRVSELIRAGYVIEKQRVGSFVNYRLFL